MINSLQQDPPICERMAVYYQTTSKDIKKPKHILHCMYVDTTCPKVARSIAMEELYTTKEVFVIPMLVLVQGGKA